MGQWITTEREQDHFCKVSSDSPKIVNVHENILWILVDLKLICLSITFSPVRPHPELISQRQEASGIEHVRMLVFLIPAMD